MASSRPTPACRLTETEARVLDLYDKLHQLRLELALLGSQQNHTLSSAPSDASHTPVAEGQVAEQQIQLLEAKATLSLRDIVVEGVAVAKPTLNAVHHATDSSPLERDLLPYIEQRDLAAAKAAALCSGLQAARDRLVELQIKSLDTSHRNVKLASEALQLAAKARENGSGMIQAERFNNKVAALDGQVKTSLYRWRVMKGVASAIVAGSGVDWVRDRRLRDLVLDPPD